MVSGVGAEEQAMQERLVSAATSAFLAGVRAVRPAALLARALRYEAQADTLHVCGEPLPLCGRRLWLAGGGKATAGMAHALCDLLADRIHGGVLSVPPGAARAADANLSRLSVHEGAADNLPDEDSERGAVEVAELATGLGTNDVLLVALSGGGSACLSLPVQGVTVADKRELVARLARAGADITQLNSVRKRLSQLKGGRLAALAAPAQIVTLALSDIVDDPLHLIASGPTVFDPDPSDRAEFVLRQYGEVPLPPGVVRALQDQKPVDFPHGSVRNYVVGSNAIAARAATEAARQLGFAAWHLTSSLTGNVRDLAGQYVLLAERLTDVRNARVSAERALIDVLALPLLRGCDEQAVSGLVAHARCEPTVCCVLGGEPTVHVLGSGRGGRSQQLALEVSLLLEKWRGEARVALLCGGTDGADGPTPAAGAVGTCWVGAAVRAAGLDAERARDDNDAFGLYSALDGGRYLVRTGHTGTNVMDLHILLLHFI